MDVRVSSRTVDGRTVVHVSGEIDVYTAPTLRERLTALVDQGHADLVVDLTEVRFMDSTGLGLLVGLLKRVRGLDGRLQLVIDSERLLKVFRITALTQVFTIRTTVIEALADADAP
ncbi:MAG TPA: STAS domain-containing protein [Cellulomonas sp.]